jgi:hypothetical protein
MAITTYAELQTAVQTWLDRTDIAASAPDFITLAESFFQRNLRVRQMEATASLTPSSGSATLPTDFLTVKSVRRIGSPVTTLEPLEDEEWNRLYGTTTTSGPASHYYIFGSSIFFGPSDTTAMKLDYYQKIPVLSVSNTTNWLLTAYPDLYFFASLAEAEMFDKNQQTAAIWKGRRDEVCDEVQKQQFRMRGTAQIRLQGPRP